MIYRDQVSVSRLPNRFLEPDVHVVANQLLRLLEHCKLGAGVVAVALDVDGNRVVEGQRHRPQLDVVRAGVLHSHPRGGRVREDLLEDVAFAGIG